MSDRDSICELEQKLEVEYLDVPGFANIYRVGSDGTVWTRRIRGVNADKLSPVWKRLFGYRTKKGGYLRVVLYRNGKRFKRMSVHNLVLLTFIGPRPPGMEGCHRDGNTANNALVNLRWDTHINNHKDVRKPVKWISELRGRPKLKPHQVREMRIAAASLVDSFAERFGLTRSQVVKILRGKAWSWIEA